MRYKNRSDVTSIIGILTVSVEREEGRKGGREEGRKGGREEGREGGREEGRKGGREEGQLRLGGRHLMETWQKRKSTGPKLDKLRKIVLDG